jgi:probable rRNA maturation factor
MNPALPKKQSPLQKKIKETRKSRMKIEIFGINNKTQINKYKRFANKIIARADKNKLLENSNNINIVLVNDSYIKKLNKQFLGRNRPTDVLSFPLEDELLGEIYISWDRARAQAKEQKITTGQEICNLIEHGILHLLGYSHKMMNPALPNTQPSHQQELKGTRKSGMKKTK